MPLDNYDNLQIAVLNWLGQPDDPLMTDFVPDLITVFEREADRRLRTRWSEARTTLTPDPGEFVVDLPTDFLSLRSIRLTSHDPILNIRYVTPEQLTQTAGEYFTIEGLQLHFPDVQTGEEAITIGYIQGLTPLSGAVATNWLLANHPDAYLFGALAEAEAFVQNDERVRGWLARRDAVFESILGADRKARWGGGGLQIRPDIVFPLVGSLDGTPGGGGGPDPDDPAGGLTTTFDVTLNANATSTTVANAAMSVASYIELSPLTEDAAQAIVVGIWITPGDGFCTINHTSYESVTQTFRGLIHRS